MGRVISQTGGVASSVTTPSGITIDYFPPPDRHYEIGGKTVPGVTEVLDVLDKKALVWWGQKVGIAATKNLLGRGFAVARMSEDELEEAIVREQLSVNHVRNQAGSRGKAVHDALETWATTGQIPDPAMFPESERGYVEGLVHFIDDVNPEPLDSEVMVGSMEHGFAGRYDLRLRIPQDCDVVQKVYPKRRAKKARLHPGVILADLKTSAGVYSSHHLQIEAYEGASIECGHGSSDHRGILHVTKYGKYEFVRSRGSYDGFLAVKTVYEELRRIK